MQKNSVGEIKLNMGSVVSVLLTIDMYGAVWYSSCSALQSNDFWYVFVKICAKAVATIAQDAKTSGGKEHIGAYI